MGSERVYLLHFWSYDPVLWDRLFTFSKLTVHDFCVCPCLWCLCGNLSPCAVRLSAGLEVILLSVWFSDALNRSFVKSSTICIRSWARRTLALPRVPGRLERRLHIVPRPAGARGADGRHLVSGRNLFSLAGRLSAVSGESGERIELQESEAYRSARNPEASRAKPPWLPAALDQKICRGPVL